jgi:hypothetical protein
MPGSVIMPGLVAVLLGSAAAIWAGAADGNATITAGAAAAFIATVLLAAWPMIKPLQRLAGGATATDVEGRQLSVLRRGARLSVLVYAWGAVSLFLAYKLSGLYWQHGLQYAAGMLLFAVAIFGWVHVARPGSRHGTGAGLRRAALLNAVHGTAAAIALAIFLASGKLWADRPDWVANIVFVAGGAGIVALCTMVALALQRTGRGAAAD